MKKLTKLFKTLLCAGLLMGGVTIVPSTQAKANEIVPYASFIDVTVNKDKIIKKISVGSGPLENIFFSITGSYRYSSSGPSLSNVKISVKFRNNESTSFTDDNQSIFRRVWRRRSDSHICLYSLYYLYYLSDPAGRWRWKPASYESVLWSGKFEKFKRYPRAGL